MFVWLLPLLVLFAPSPFVFSLLCPRLSLLTLTLAWLDAWPPFLVRFAEGEVEEEEEEEEEEEDDDDTEAAAAIFNASPSAVTADEDDDGAR